MLLSLALISAILFGCQSTSETRQPDSELQKDNETLLLNRKMKEVIISESNRSSVTVSKNEDFIESFRNIISSAVKEQGIANMSNPEYLINVVYENESEQSFNLWIGQTETKATLMKTDDTHTIYTISEEMTDKLINLVWGTSNK